jgi:predicted RNA-binding Zn-ribbon protein involved in translation (DUF1610 family)
MAWGFGGVVIRFQQRRMVLNMIDLERAVEVWIHRHDPSAWPYRTQPSSTMYQSHITCPHCGSALQHVTDMASATQWYQCSACVYRVPG